MIRFFSLISLLTNLLFSSEKVSLQLLWKHQFEFAGFYMAKEKGFYKKAGLDVEIKEFDFGIDIVEDVVSGVTDFGVGRSSLVLDKLRGKDISLLFAVYQSSPYVLLANKRADLKEIDDFKNKRIMLSSDLESIAAISAMMKIKNIKKSDYRELAHSFNINDVIDGKADLMTVYMSNEPFEYIKNNLEYTIFNPKDYGFNFYADIVYTSQSYLQNNHDKVKKFKEASLKGWHYAFNNIDETIDVILKKYNSQNRTKKALEYEANVLKSLAFDSNKELGVIEKQRVNEIANLYRLLGMTKKGNEALDNLIFEYFELKKFLYELLSSKTFIASSLVVVSIIFLLLFRQYILRKKNIELEEAKDKLEKSELRWKFAIEGSRDGLWDWNLQENSAYFSPQWKTMLGYEDHEIENTLEEWSKRVHPDQLDKVFADVNAYLGGKTDIYRNEHQLLCKDGSYKWILDRGMIIQRDDDNKPLRMIGTHTDIDQHKLLEEELSQAKEAAELASKSKSNFLANMSHEIRTPMTGLLGFVDRLQKEEIDPTKVKQFQIIRNSGETLLSIINDILDFSKIECGKMEVEYSPMLLRKFFYDTPSFFQHLASAKNINLLHAINENLPESILGDNTRLKQVIFNLMSNAIKFTNDGGSVTIQAYYNDKTKLLHVAVIDSGIGIAKDNQKKIFDAFSQEDVSTTRKFGGTGLGLSISSRLIGLMGGELKLKSQVGKGSKFYFDIPVEICVVETDENLLGNKDEELSFNGHVLVVEDNKTNQMLMGMILDDYGVTYDIANDGAEGVLKFNQKNYDIILMDENMPIMNGIEAASLIREKEQEKDSHTPIVAVTANALVQDRKRFLDAGMDDYISKPYTEEDIVRVLKKYLG